MQIPKISIGDVLTMKKQHPCGGKMFKVLRVGSDIKISCMIIFVIMFVKM